REVDQTVADITRKITEEEPPRIANVVQRFRGEVDALVAKAMSRQRENRYHNASALADDIRRFLKGDPLLAVGSGTRYGLQKIVERHRVECSLLVTLLLVVAVVGGLLINSRLSSSDSEHLSESRRREVQQRFEAEEQRERADGAERQAHRLSEEMALVRYAHQITRAQEALRRNASADAAQVLNSTDAEQRSWDWRYLNSQLDQSEETIKAPSGQTQALAFSDDGSLLACGMSAGRVAIFDFASRRLLHRSKPHSEGFGFGLDFRADGKFLATGSKRKLMVFQVGSWEVSSTIAIESPPQSIEFHADGNSLLTASRDGTARVWDWRSGNVTLELAHDRDVWCARWDAARGRIVTACHDGWLRSFDAKTGELLFEQRVPDDLGRERSYWPLELHSPTGRIVTGYWDGRIRLWDAVSLAPERTLARIDDAILRLAMSSDGSRLAAVCGDGAIRTWELNSGAELQSLRGHAPPARSLAFCPETYWIASATKSQDIKIWDTDTTKGRRRGPHHLKSIESVAAHADSELAASGCHGNEIMVWRLATGEILWRARAREHVARDLAFSADGKQLASAGLDTTARVWSVETGSQIAVLEHPERGLESVSFHPGGEWLATGAIDGSAQIWDLGTLQVKIRLGDESSACHGVQFHPSGESIAVAYRNGTLVLFDSATGETIRSFSGGPGRRDDGAMAFSPNGDRLAGGFTDGTIRVWDVESGREVLRWRGHGLRIRDLTFSSDGRRLATACADRSVGIWDASGGQRLLSLKTDHNWPLQIAFASDFLVANFQARAAFVWGTGSGAERAKFQSEARSVATYVESLFREHVRLPSVLEAIETDSALSVTKRRAARSAALQQGESPIDLLKESWRIALPKGQADEIYRRAASLARRVVELEPTRTEARRVQALVFLRIDEVDRALETLKVQRESIETTTGALDVILFGLASAYGENLSDARQALELANERMKKPGQRSRRKIVRLLRELDALVP
ncbi:MAG: hypothetical protein AAF517_20030, partial [Planctomycetota bacterium]